MAVIAVLTFHADWGWAGGGFLGVSLFFTLSGYLITSLLLDEGVALGRFWARRTRRLLPAAIVTMIGVLAADRLGAFGETTGLAGDAVASLGQVANWRFLLDDRSYADLFGGASPLLHYWSLGIEEQWYLTLPLAVLAIRRSGGGPRAIAAVLAAATIASAALPWMFEMSADRVYYGTDTRIAEITIGGFAAAVAAHRRVADPRRPPTALRWAAPLALGAMAASWVLVDRSHPGLERGLLTAHALLAVVVVVAAASGTAVARPLGWAPLVALGRVSYSLYLVHWPLWSWLDADTTGLDDPWLSVVRIVAAVGAAVALHRFVETPILDGRTLARPAHAVGALAVGAVAVLALSATEPGSRTVVDFEAAAAAVRPDGLAGTTLEEIAASARAAAAPLPQAAMVAPPEDRDDRGADAPTVPTGSPGAAPDASPAPAAPPIELAPGELSLGQALDIVAATGTGFYPERSEGDQPAQRTLAFDPTSSAPRTIVFGDSAALMLGFGLTTWGRDTGLAQVVDLGVVGCGLVRGGLRLEPDGAVDVGERCGDWAPAFSSLADLLAPDLVVLHYGLWETVDRLVTGWDDWRRIGDADFDLLLVQEIRTATRIFTDRNIAVAWVNSPPLSPANLPDSRDPVRIERLNALIARTVASEPGATVIDLDTWFSQRPAGPMDPALRPDGVHVSYAGSDIVAGWLGPRLLSALEQLR